MFRINIEKLINSITIIILLFLLIFAACNNKDDDDQKAIVDKTIGIVIIDKAILRIDPMLYSSVISYRNKGEIALILGKSKEKLRLGNEEFYWYYVRFSGEFTGWIYGGNLKIFPADKNREIEKYLSGIRAIELRKFRKKITGTWGSADNVGSVKQRLELFEDGKYRSYRSESNTIEGEYSINFKEREIIFKNGTYFGNKIIYFPLSSGNYLKKSANDSGIKFIKISSKIYSAEDEKKKDDKPGA